MSRNSIGSFSKIRLGLILIWSIWCIGWIFSGVLCTYTSFGAQWCGVSDLNESRGGSVLLVALVGYPMGIFMPALLHQYFSFGESDYGVVEYLVDGLTAALAGYVQWFVLVPWLWRKWKNRKGVE